MASAKLLDCRNVANEFCFVCAKYTSKKYRGKFTSYYQRKYKEAFNVKQIKNVDQKFTPNIICFGCKKKIASTKFLNKSGKPILDILIPASWSKPRDKSHKDCYLCQHKLSIAQKSHPKSIKYNGNLSCKLPVFLKDFDEIGGKPKIDENDDSQSDESENEE